MIEIIGVQQGKEFEAATHVRKQILAVWPDIGQSTDDQVRIFVGLKLYGYRIEDIDLLVVGHLAKPRPFDIEFKFHPRDGAPFIPLCAVVQNFILVIEVKSHDASGVRFNNKIASVRYHRSGRDIWESVTEKNRQQMFEMKRYLADHGVEHVYIQDLIFFSSLKEHDLPKRPHNCFGIDSSFERILNILGQIASPSHQHRDARVSFGSSEVFHKVLSPDFPLFQSFSPTPLDRRRMDRIAKAAVPATWLDDLGQKHLVIRGRGGVGKTVILLQMAYQAFERAQLRSMVLTYNRALVADMRRTMALLGVPRSVGKGGVAIETVHTFVGRLMRGLGILPAEHHFLEAYEDHKDLLLSYIRTGAVTRTDIDALIEQYATDFGWDMVFVDEGQDWPPNEIEILRAVYTSERIAVADGVDQFVRSSVADWSRGVTRERFRSRRLTRCLRMKANLAHFATDFVTALGLQDWDLEPNPDATGGRVLVVEGDLAHQTALYERVCSEASQLGNYPVDLLACVSPSLVQKQDHETFSVPGHTLATSGRKVWDASSIDVREHFPTDRDALRIVQYDSCRGLEGWTVINYGFDEFWEYKYRQWLASPHEPDNLFETTEERAALFASLWAMIPLTRAIDTLVINVSAQPSLIKQALIQVQEQRADFVEWIKL